DLYENECATNPGKTGWPRPRPASCRARTIASRLQTRLRIGLCRCGPRAARESPIRSPYRLCSLPVNSQRAIRHVALCQVRRVEPVHAVARIVLEIRACSQLAAATGDSIPVTRDADCTNASGAVKGPL